MFAASPLPPGLEAIPNRCTFEHPLFSKLGEVVFRLAEADNVPSLVMPLGRSTAVLPLRSLQAELGIDGASADGQMLARVARSLNFVADLRLGDLLPVEVLDGAASWEASPSHQQLAASRLRLRLISQLGADVPADWDRAGPQTVLLAAAQPGMRLALQAACIEAAARLGIPDAAAATRLVEDATHELGFIEALRDWLLRRVTLLAERVRCLAAGLAQNLSGLELLSRVTRLTSIAVEKIGARFADVDAQTANVLDVLQALDAWRAVIRQHRDWLYCSLRGWEPILAAWELATPGWSAATWPLLGRTYRFLAPRFMPVQEWQTARAKRHSEELGPRMVW